MRIKRNDGVPEMPFCPECASEYKDGITICPDCGCELRPAPEKTADYRNRDIKWVKLCTMQGYMFGEMLKEILENARIPCIIHGSPLQAYQTHGIGFDTVTIMVPAEQLEEARDMKNELFGNA